MHFVTFCQMYRTCRPESVPQPEDNAKTSSFYLMLLSIPIQKFFLDTDPEVFLAYRTGTYLDPGKNEEKKVYSFCYIKKVEWNVLLQ